MCVRVLIVDDDVAFRDMIGAELAKRGYDVVGEAGSVAEARVVLPRLDPDATCRMVFASSLAFRRGSFDHIAYTAAKGGIAGLVRALARALAPKVLVNGVAPGIILTGMPEHMLETPERRERLLAETTLKRFGHPREVATVLRFLLSDDSSFMTGQLINVDGGVVYS